MSQTSPEMAPSSSPVPDALAALDFEAVVECRSHGCGQPATVVVNGSCPGCGLASGQRELVCDQHLLKLASTLQTEYGMTCARCGYAAAAYVFWRVVGRVA